MAADPRVGEHGWFLEKVESRFNIWHGVVDGTGTVGSGSNGCTPVSAGKYNMRLTAFDEESQVIDVFNRSAKGRC